MGSSTGLTTEGWLWASAFGACLIVEVLSAWLCVNCLYTIATLSKYMNAMENYDRGKLLRIMSCLAAIGGMVSIFGGGISFLCMRTNKAYRMRYIIYSYLVWGSTMIVIYIIAAAYIFVSSDFKDTFSVRTSTIVIIR